MQIIILGSTPLALSVADKLLANGDEVVMVGPNCSELCETYNIDCVSINGLIIDTGILFEAGIENCDCVCAVSDNEKMNLMACQIAKKKFNVRKVISSVDEFSEYRIYEDMGIVPISSVDLTAENFYDEIFDEFTMERGIEGEETYKIFGRDHKFKLIEVDPSLYGVKYKNVVDSQGGSVFALVRDGDMIHNAKDMRLKAGDRLVIASVIY